MSIFKFVSLDPFDMHEYINPFNNIKSNFMQFLTLGGSYYSKCDDVRNAASIKRTSNRY